MNPVKRGNPFFGGNACFAGGVVSSFSCGVPSVGVVPSSSVSSSVLEDADPDVEELDDDFVFLISPSNKSEKKKRRKKNEWKRGERKRMKEKKENRRRKNRRKKKDMKEG